MKGKVSLLGSILGEDSMLMTVRIASLVEI